MCMIGIDDTLEACRRTRCAFSLRVRTHAADCGPNVLLLRHTRAMFFPESLTVVECFEEVSDQGASERRRGGREEIPKKLGSLVKFRLCQTIERVAIEVLGP